MPFQDASLNTHAQGSVEMFFINERKSPDSVLSMLSKKACDTGPHALMIHKVNHKCIDKGTLPFSIQ